MRLSKRDEHLVRKMLDEITEIEIYTSDLDIVGFMNSKITQRAVAMTMINIGELSKKLSEAILETMKSVPWGKIRGFRNLVAHQYDDIVMEEFWIIVKQDIPNLKDALIKQQFDPMA